MYAAYKRTESVPEIAFYYFFKILEGTFIIVTFGIFYIWIYFFQYWTSCKQLWIYEIFCLFMALSGELVGYGEVNQFT